MFLFRVFERFDSIGLKQLKTFFSKLQLLITTVNAPLLYELKLFSPLEEVGRLQCLVKKSNFLETNVTVPVTRKYKRIYVRCLKSIRRIVLRISHFYRSIFRVS